MISSQAIEKIRSFSTNGEVKAFLDGYELGHTEREQPEQFVLSPPQPPPAAAPLPKPEQKNDNGRYRYSMQNRGIRADLLRIFFRGPETIQSLINQLGAEKRRAILDCISNLCNAEMVAWDQHRHLLTLTIKGRAEALFFVQNPHLKLRPNKSVGA